MRLYIDLDPPSTDLFDLCGHSPFDEFYPIASHVVSYFVGHLLVKASQENGTNLKAKINKQMEKAKAANIIQANDKKSIKGEPELTDP